MEPVVKMGVACIRGRCGSREYIGISCSSHDKCVEIRSKSGKFRQ